MTNAPIAFPQTYDPVQGEPRYSASDFRLTAGAALAVPDGSAFGGIQGVRAGSPSPLATIDGTTVTVAAHMGWLCPWPGGNGTYSYALPAPLSKPIGSTTGSYKIAVILEDKAAGHGKSELVDVKVYPGYTLDSQIPGLVVARVESGVASDVAPVISQDATIRVPTLAQLAPVRAADGVQAVLSDGSRYEMRSGSWTVVSARYAVPAWQNAWWDVLPVRLTRVEDAVLATTRITRLQGQWTGDNGNELGGRLPAMMCPDMTQWVYLDGRFGLYVNVGTDGRVTFGRDQSRSYAAMGVGQRIDIQASWHVA